MKVRAGIPRDYVKAMTRFLLTAILLIDCTAPLLAADGGITLATAGRSAYRIVLPDAPSDPDRHAAEELARFLKQSTGAELPIVGEAGAGDGPAILVGWGTRAKALAAERKPESFGAEEFVIETHPPHLLLAGGSPRGTLYAVYAFLEEHVGCRWYSSTVQNIPAHADLSIGRLRERQRPAFEYREPFAFDSFDGDWSVRNKCNGHAARLDVARGGQITYQGFVHTFLSLVPPDAFFGTHPEYFSEIDGKRVRDHGQLCLTNPELPAVVAGRVIELLKDAPPSSIVSVSQNDWHGWCQCARCREAAEAEGGVSGPLVGFVNAVADRVGKVRPDVAIDTLAYQQSRKPPRTVRPRPNVIVRLCSIECSFAKPLGTAGGGPNRAFAADIEGWSRLCQRLYIWDYVTDFAHYVQPHPNFRVLRPNLEFFANNGVKGVFEQGSYQSPGGEFQELRSWVLAKLLWNPKADTDKLVNDFLAGYYGAAAGPVRGYFDLIHDAVGASGDELGCYSPVTAGFLSAETVGRADALWEEAERLAAATGDRALVQRVRVGRLPVWYVMLARETVWNRTAPGWKPTVRGSALRQRFFETAAAAHMTHISEPQTMDGFRSSVMAAPERRTSAVPPPGCETLAADRWQDFQDDTFSLANPGEWVKLEADAAASDGAAARMPGNHHEWAVQLPLDAPVFSRRPAQKWHIEVAVRVERAGREGVAFTYGIYDHETRQGLGGGTVKVSDIHGDAYQMFDLGVHTASARRTLWVAPAANAANVPAVWVDRFVLRAAAD